MPSKKIQWPTVAALAVVVAAVLAAYLAGPALGVPEESHAQLVAGVGVVGSLLLAAMRSLLSTDADGDGTPALTDSDDHDPEVQ